MSRPRSVAGEIEPADDARASDEWGAAPQGPTRRRRNRCGVLVMAYGTPRDLGELEAYYTDIRRGRPPSAEQLRDLRRRYEAIGGLSPLGERTEAQRAAIAAALGPEFSVTTGFRHAVPSIEAAVAELTVAGVDGIVGLVLAPHFSPLSVGAYHARAAAAAAGDGIEYRRIDSWATEPALIDFLSDAVGRGLEPLPAPTTVVFTAHSLPRRILDTDDPYPAELEATAAAVAERAGLEPGTWSVAWQSAGRTPEPWLTPAIAEVIADTATNRPDTGLLVCPCGFVADHLEVRYDLDIEAARVAAERGVRFSRTDVVNDDPAVMAALAARVRARAATQTQTPRLKRGLRGRGTQ